MRHCELGEKTISTVDAIAKATLVVGGAVVTLRLLRLRRGSADIVWKGWYSPKFSERERTRGRQREANLRIRVECDNEERQRR